MTKMIEHANFQTGQTARDRAAGRPVWPLHLIQLLSVVGLLVAFYLYLYHEQIVTVNCEAGAFFDCSRVSGPTSPYSTIGELPVALIGLVGYAAIFLVTWARQLSAWVDRYTAVTLLVFTSLGMGFTLYLKALELTVIHAMCEYCLYSAVIMAIMFALALIDFRNERGNKRKEKS